jgi:hypothetical protein
LVVFSGGNDLNEIVRRWFSDDLHSAAIIHSLGRDGASQLRIVPCDFSRSFNGKPQATVFYLAVACGLPLNKE